MHAIQSNIPSKITATMKLKGGPEINFQIDTGTTCDVLKLSSIKGTKYVNKIMPTNHVLKMYNASTLRPLGKCKVQLMNSRDKKKYKVNFTIVEDEHCVNLIRSKTAQQMQLITIRNDKIKPCSGPAECASTASVDVSLTSNRQLEGLTLEHLCSQYEDVFDGLGNLGTPLRLEVDETVKPVQQPLRRVPEALRTPLKEYLDDLEARGVIEKVERSTEWVNSMVITRKANGNLRLCLDPKPLNKALKRCHFPMPVTEDILLELGKAKIFTKLDCKDGYWQIKLTEESSLLTTFATPFGRYKWNRMPFGILPASEIFQLCLHEAVEGLDGVYAIADDILVAGTGDTLKNAVADHDAFKQTEVPYIGQLLTSEGVKADPSKIEAVIRMERPTDVTGVQRIMGTVGYLTKFLPRLFEVSQPLRQLTKKGTEFLWDEVHDRAFSRIKEMVTASPLLKYYEREKDLVIQCDASKGGLGAALLQDGRPLAYASRALTAAERNYTQIEKELLAIVFSTERFHQYTYGRSVIVESDHKPLESILAKPLVSAPKRLQRMILRLQRYDLDVRYKKGSELHLADTLSRHYPKFKEATQDQREHVLFARSAFEEGLEVEQVVQEINHLLVSEHKAQMFRLETKNDEVLQAVKAIVQSGWPAERRELSPTVAIYYDIRDELVIQDGRLFRGDSGRGR